MKTALSIIEEVYDIALNPEADYYAQLEPLAANGELANHNSSMRVLFKMAMLLDEQAKVIESLKDRQRTVAPDPMQPIVTQPDEQTSESSGQ